MKLRQKSTIVKDFLISELLSVSMKLLSHFERRGFNMETLETIYPKINGDYEGDFAVNFLEALVAR